jgi:predicted AlkP superfamily pyrophosphatase or phosphodiesterase
MKYFIKLNSLSVLYAFMLFVVIELLVDIYRISRISGLELDKVNNLELIFIFVLFIFCSIGFVWMTKKYLNGKKSKYFTTILWYPYLILFINLFAAWFPITEAADKPVPVTGLIIIGAMIIYPFYIVMINIIASINFKSDAG